MSAAFDPEDFAFYRGEATDCPYLPDRRWTNLIAVPRDELEPGVLGFLLDHGFRRGGTSVFRPICQGCEECRTMRVDVERFRPSRSQRRARHRNADVRVTRRRPALDEERRVLLERFLAARYEGPMTADAESVEEYLFADTGFTWEIDYHVGDRLVAWGIFDLLPEIGSSVYFCFDPDESRRSLGVFSMLEEIELTRAGGARWFHPGYYVAGSAAMRYKASYGPAELLVRGHWAPLVRAADPAP
ncbi:MAG: arginyltransferase [Planctomycetota bacterium]